MTGNDRHGKALAFKVLLAIYANAPNVKILLKVLVCTVQSHSVITRLSAMSLNNTPHLIQALWPPPFVSLYHGVCRQCQPTTSLTWQQFVSLQITDRLRQVVGSLFRSREISDSNLVLKTLLRKEFFDSSQANKGNYLKLGNNRFPFKFL